jgi:hypothetical protein
MASDLNGKKIKERKRRLILGYVQDISEGKPWRYGHHETVNELREFGGEWADNARGLRTLHELTWGLVSSEEEMKQLAMKTLLQYTNGESPLAGKEGRRKGCYSDSAKAVICCLRDFVIAEKGISVPMHLEKMLGMTSTNIKELAQAATVEALENVKKGVFHQQLTKDLFINDAPEKGVVLVIYLDKLNHAGEKVATASINRLIDGQKFQSNFTF